MSLVVRQALPEDRASWEGFRTEHSESEAGHAWEFTEMLRRLFRPRIASLVVERDGRFAGLLPLVYQRSFVGRFLTAVPYLNHAGVLADAPDARRALAQEAQALAGRLGAQRLELRGRRGNDLGLPVSDAKCGYLLELPVEAETLWKALGSKLRAQVRRPQREGYEAQVVADGAGRFYPLLARRWRELGSPILPLRFFTELERVFPDAVRYVIVEREGRIAAAALILRHRGTLEIPWAASRIEDNRFGVNMLQYWTALEYAVRSGANRFDFGRSTPGTGNARFKRQWGAVEAPLEWSVVTRGDRGASSERGSRSREWVAAVWRRLPLPLTRGFGPFLAARIPF